MSEPVEKSTINITLIALQKQVSKLEKEHDKTLKLATKAVRENGLLRIEIQRLTTRINANENNIRHNRSKR